MSFQKNSLQLRSFNSLLRRRFQKFLDTSKYRRWVKKYDLITKEYCAEILNKIAALDRFSQPKISIILPVYNTSLTLLKEAISSVTSQLYQNWELCIADDHSNDIEVLCYLRDLPSNDARIKVIFSEQRNGISITTNTALQLATGDFVAFLDHDDLLSHDALAEVAFAVAAHPKVDYLYSDEDKVSLYGRRSDPFFKPDWNPDLLTSLNYCSHLSVIRRSLVAEEGGLNAALEGAQDWDLILRITEKTKPQNIIHIPKILYHWRLSKNSTARSARAKPYIVKASKQVLEQCLLRRGRLIYGMEPVNEGGQWRVRYALPNPAPKVSIIIPTRNRYDLLQKCVESIQKRTNYPNYEILIADNDSDDPKILTYYQVLEKKENIRIISCPGLFNYSAINNSAVSHAQGEVLILLNNDIEVIESHWLKELVSHAVRPEIGAVGALLCYSNGGIQHAGVVLGISGSVKAKGVAGHVGKLFREPRYVGGNRMRLVQNFSAVTGACLAVRKKIYEEVRGLDETGLPVSFNDVDFCLKLRAANYWNIWTPFAKLVHYESASRGRENTPEKKNRFRKEVAVMRGRWGSLLDNDPAYNPNLTLIHENWGLAWPPRKKE